MNNLNTHQSLTASMIPFAAMVLALCIGTYVIAFGSMAVYTDAKKSPNRKEKIRLALKESGARAREILHQGRDLFSRKKPRDEESDE